MQVAAVPLSRRPAPSPASQAALDPDDAARASFYAWSAALLIAPPDARCVELLAASPSVDEGGAPLLPAWEQLVRVARGMAPAAVAEEHEAIFGGGTKPQVDPYASRYRTGSLMDQPLARLRADLRALGLERAPGAGVTEDHLGALCEAMRALVAGTPGTPPRPLATQRGFFHEHIADWHPACLDDMCAAPGAHFYAVVADFVGAFLAVERAAFDMDAETPGAP